MLLSGLDLHCLVPTCEETQREAVNILKHWLYSVASLKSEDFGFFGNLWCFTYGYWTRTSVEIHFNVKMIKKLGRKLDGMLID